MTLLGYTFDGEVAAGLMFVAALLLLWVGLSRPRPKLTSHRRGELSLEREDDRPPPAPDGPRGPWG